jgi:IclR family acetate operon transcriptional repressor
MEERFAQRNDNQGHVSPRGLVPRTFSVLDALVEGAPQATLGQIAQRSGLPKPTVHRILAALVKLGFARNGGDGSYLLGSQALRLAGRVLSSVDYAGHAGPALRALQEHTGETIHFAILSGSHATYVEKLEGRRPYRMASRVGMGLPLHSTAIGKAILAHLAPDERAALLRRLDLVRLTPNTISDIPKLEAELAIIRQQGYSIDEEENEEGIRCVGAPVFARGGRVIGSLSVSAPAFQLSAEEARRLAPHVITAAREVSLSLGVHAQAEAKEDE